MIKDRLEMVRKRIQRAAEACGRNTNDVHLVAVSKTMPREKLVQAVEAGVTVLGENYVQEAREKFNDLYTLPVSWHFIGHLQSNKAKYVVNIFDLIHSVDSVKLAREIDKQAKKINKIQDILIQVNIAGEASKSGIRADDALSVIRDISGLEHIAVKGLMTMPPYFNAPEKVRPYFKALRELRDRIDAEHIENVSLDDLSMGMTGDFEAAIREGATLVRIGTAIFGERN
ncbi:MAG: YggS family pyridoxal phosphate-dependent enzyme [Deltaproteobacteria bacterium]|nr:YggS family pyridoxal phosphate-dependent enzyme [Deltaproteobacteria bacterium]